jgi:hypothetical protein
MDHLNMAPHGPEPLIDLQFPEMDPVDRPWQLAFHNVYPELANVLPRWLQVEVEKVLQRTFVRASQLSFATPGSTLVSILELTVRLFPTVRCRWRFV